MKKMMLIALAVAFANCAQALDQASLDKVNQQIMGNTTFNIDTMINQSTKPVETGTGINYLRVVLYGILYRGGSGTRGPMDSNQLKLQCESGFGADIFGYGSVRGESVSCQEKDGKTNGFIYKSMAADPRNLKELFSDISDAISGKTGPVLVHCWFGQHESGEMATYALMQFCGYNVAQATSYWEKHAAGSQSPAYNAVRTNIASFPSLKSMYSEFTISPADQALICPH